ncbi:carbonic anhydrase [Rathayibacter toxicus]|uniref:carbonic anhydrase n=1 Tax=Rathayibacter toxicus TaxID=145458 RepID=A0A2S5Y686_9MICO|nr:carbonic anhydrase [Rathayibacter toxicus]PPG20473.1 carbonic anhydrase [Rathayibacter toxicus]PPG45575.1 carbonic anhydrase [Rathayibacter toxicus]PPH22675.1 carbonic anhydrase [Rathayibacter toxicus]PPH56878.1 carbonic anhydrase [Rathayibacter toxicus]PPH59569.1 carbonic anhydrase [Rathayibacter toxicus]
MSLDTPPLRSAIPRESRPPAWVWKELLLGNQRFVAGEPRHPRQDVERRTELAAEQRPLAALFGCSDSRLAAEIIFDLGLGDLFVVRNAGQVIADSIIGSLEYSVAVLGVKLILVLGHDECGAVQAAIDSQAPNAERLPPHIEHLIQPIIPAVRRRVEPQTDGRVVVDPALMDALAVGREHLRDTVAELLQHSPLIADAVSSGALAVVGANYCLKDGTVVSDVVLGIDPPQLSPYVSEREHNGGRDSSLTSPNATGPTPA